MLVREQVEEAVELQRKGYRLLRWLDQAVPTGLIVPEAFHLDMTLEQSTQRWIERCYEQLPDDVRPSRERVVAFSNLFATYLWNTFDWDAAPGERLYSRDAHCFCPMCSWMVQAPSLSPKKVGAADKAIARRAMRDFTTNLAAELGGSLPEERAESLASDPAFREALGLCAYAVDLLQRLQGVAVGAASLVLWRTFAWTPQGSPRPDFVLTADAIMAAQDAVAREVRRAGTFEEPGASR